MVGVLGSLVLGEENPRTPGNKNSKPVGEAPPAGGHEEERLRRGRRRWGCSAAAVVVVGFPLILCFGCGRRCWRKALLPDRRSQLVLDLWGLSFVGRSAGKKKKSLRRSSRRREPKNSSGEGLLFGKNGGCSRVEEEKTEKSNGGGAVWPVLCEEEKNEMALGRMERLQGKMRSAEKEGGAAGPFFFSG
uniref:Uncharacterized protein n=1 Tax=Populus alba TaxID=43335 RepID=A0A4U5PSZ0_POPAL|nr:hypothetical protein D5086_0000182080 [Populus alba]